MATVSSQRSGHLTMSFEYSRLPTESPAVRATPPRAQRRLLARGGRILAGCVLAGLLLLTGYPESIATGQSTAETDKPLTQESRNKGDKRFGSLQKSLNTVLRRAHSGDEAKINARPPVIPEIMDSEPHLGTAWSSSEATAGENPAAAANTGEFVAKAVSFTGDLQHQPAAPRLPTPGSGYRSINGRPDAESRELNRHPLVFQQENQSPPVQNAPHRSILIHPDPDSVTPLSDTSGEPELVLPPRMQLSESWDGQAWDREQFWKQFATSPTPGSRTGSGHNQSLSAAMRNGSWFGGLDILFVEPIFQSNNAFVTTDSATGISSAAHADYNFDPAWKGFFGFESSGGPGLELSWLNYNQFSDTAMFQATGTENGVARIDYGAPGNAIALSTVAAGDRLESRQQIKLNSVDILVFKDQQNPISRVRGSVGIRYVSLKHLLFADLTSSTGATTAVRNVNDWEGLGPKLGVDYFRPIGHTKLEFQSGLFVSLLFGRRDQVVTEVGSLQFSQIGKIEPMGILEMYLGVQRNFHLSRCRTAFVRTALESQYWIGGESAIESGTDFGFYGLSVGFGIAR